MSNNKSQQPHSSQALVKSSAIVSLGVLASRFLGFFRDMVIAHYLGTGWMADAFFVAQRIPNLLRDLVGEGAANAAIVPVLTEYQHQKPQHYAKLINAVMLWAVLILGAVSLVGILAAPLIVKLIAPGFSDPVQYELTVQLTRIIFPYLILIALTAIQVGILYSRQHYLSASFSSCLMNIIMIAAVWLAASMNFSIAYSLAVAVVLGGIAQFLWQWISLKRIGVHWDFNTSLKHEGVKKIGKLLLPRLWGSAVYQLNIFVDTFCASLVSIVGTGGIAAIYYANRLVQFPLGVFGYALASVTLPTLSTLATHNDKTQFRNTVVFAVENLLFVLIPTAILMGILGDALVKVIFERGAFDAQSRDITVQALTFFAIGLPFFGITRILVLAFYALQDTRTPVRIATMCLIINIVGNAILMFPMKIGGIALASSISSMVNVILLVHALNNRMDKIEINILHFLRGIIPALVIMTLITLGLLNVLTIWLWLKVLLILSIGLLVYFVICIIMNVNQAKQISRLIRRKK